MLTVRPKFSWNTGKAFKFPVDAIVNDAVASDRILRAKRLIFGTIAGLEAEGPNFLPCK